MINLITHLHNNSGDRLRHGREGMGKAPRGIGAPSIHAIARVRALCLRRRRACAGLTLVELLLVAMIMSVLGSIALSQYHGHIEKTRNAQAIMEIRSIEPLIAQYQLDNRTLPGTLADVGRGGMLDPWQRPYQYTNLSGIKGKGASRKDKNLVPLNSDYDLYSMGPDGKSVMPLTAKDSRDDIIRANDGRFVGKAAEY